MTTLRFAILVIATSLAASGVRAQPPGNASSFQIGTAAILVPTPQGFVETSRRSKELWDKALAYRGGAARIIGHFVTEKDLAAFEKGKEVTFKEYLLVQTPRSAESLIATQAQFDKLRSGTVALQADLAEKIEPRLSTELERISKNVSTAKGEDIKFRLGEIIPVSVDRNDSRVLIHTVLAQVSTSQEKSKTNQNMISTTAYCFVSGKVVVLIAYRHFLTPQDIQSSRTFVNSWANSVLSAN
ncbi:hypothetical protein [Methylophilus sp. 5]|uniref:hypothetical protein n=1 Tax=Methylophilus sp. 5 TaxID=1112274 RepID=UPI00048C8589|nr:hypothetical protein [Methylophilus sp. 5]